MRHELNECNSGAIGSFLLSHAWRKETVEEEAQEEEQEEEGLELRDGQESVRV